MLAKFYQQIQVVMSVLGHYDGKCNGVWGQKSIEAMRKWELDDGFEPATPQNGKPFTGRGKLPDGIHYGAGLTLVTEHLYSERAKELLATPLLTCAMIAEQCGSADHVHESKVEEKAEPEFSYQPADVPAPVVTVTEHDPVPVEQEPAEPTPVEDVTEPTPVEDVTEPAPSDQAKTEEPAQQHQQGKRDWTQNRKNK